MKNVLFVCTGNTCRSPMAEGIFNKILEDRGVLGIKSFSAGVNVKYSEAAAENAQKVMAEIGIDISTHKSQEVTPKIMSDADIVVVMSNRQINFLKAKYPEFANKVVPIIKDKDITDPFGSDISSYRKCRDEINGALKIASDICLLLE